jgi:hypothetical protein
MELRITKAAGVASKPCFIACPRAAMDLPLYGKDNPS